MAMNNLNINSIFVNPQSALPILLSYEYCTPVGGILPIPLRDQDKMFLAPDDNFEMSSVERDMSSLEFIVNWLEDPRVAAWLESQHYNPSLRFMEFLDQIDNVVQAAGVVN